MIEIRDNEFNLLKSYLTSICGIEVPPEKRYLFKTRLSDFMEQEGCDSFSVLYQRLTKNNDVTLQRHLIQAMATHESSFFRDGHPFDLLTNKLLPELITRRAEEARFVPPRLRILSAGCSLGQEPYSVAMCIHEWLERNPSELAPENVRILGIDVSSKAISRARKGVYSAQELGRNLPDRYRRAYFEETEQGLAVVPDIRQMITFADLNLARPFRYIGKFDLILCRNVLIYFSAEVKSAVLEQFHYIIQPDGYLLLGASESLYNITKRFAPVHEGPSVFYVPVQED